MTLSFGHRVSIENSIVLSNTKQGGIVMGAAAEQIMRENLDLNLSSGTIYRSFI
jgi:hypothetical protein